MHNIRCTLSAYLLTFSLCSATLLCGPSQLVATPKGGEPEQNAQEVWPIKQWKVDFDRAHAQGKQQELLKLIDISHDFALIWFYGEVFTLATPAAPAALKSKISTTLLLIAQRLSEKGIHQPRLLLERRDSDEFTEMFQQVTELQDQLEARAPTLVSLNQRLSLCFEQVKRPQLIDATFYGLLHRALLRTGAKYLANPTAELSLINASTPLAECGFVFERRAERWRALRSYHGGEVPDHLNKTLLDQGVISLWASIEGQRWSEAYTRAKGVLDLLKNKAGARLSSAAIYLVLAQVIGSEGRSTDAIKFIENVERAFADRGDQEALMQHLGLMKLHLLAEGSQWDELSGVLKDLLTRPSHFKRNLYAQRILVHSTQALLNAVEEASASGRNREALPLIPSTTEALKRLTTDEMITELYPQELRADVVSKWRLKYAQFLALTARIYEKMGALDRARAQLDDAQKSHPDPAAARELLLGWDLDRARLSMDSGDPKASLAEARRLLDVLYKEGRVRLLAVCSWIIASSFHALGQEYNAFSYANYGLKILAKLKEGPQRQASRGVHADLHSVAGHALAGLGYLTQASARLKRSLAFEENEDRRASYVWLLKRQGLYQEAFDALNKFKSNPLRAQVLRGCVKAERGEYEEAVEALQATYALNNDPSLALMGRTCLVYAHLMGKIPASVKLSYLLSNLEEATKRSNDPRMFWRWEAINALAQQSSSKDINQILDGARRAEGGWRLVRGERLIQGWSLEAQTFALPRSPKELIRYTHSALGRPRVGEDAVRHIELGWWAQAYDQPLPQTRLALRRAIMSASSDETFAQEDLKAERLRSSLMSELSHQLMYSPSPGRLKDRARLLEAAKRVTVQPSSYEATLFASRPSLPSFNPEVMSVYYLASERSLYRLTQRGAQLVELKKIGQLTTITAQLKSWLSAISQRPSPWPAGARRDPQVRLWQQGKKLTQQLLPRELTSQSPPLQLNYWFSPELLNSWGFVPPLESLPLSVKTGRATGELPHFLGVHLPTFFMADVTASRAPKDSIQQTSLVRVADCAQSSVCGSNWSPLEVNERLLANPGAKRWGTSSVLLWSDPIEGLSLPLSTLNALPGSHATEAKLIYIERNQVTPNQLIAYARGLMTHGLDAIAWPQWQAQGERSPVESLVFSTTRGLPVITSLHFQRLKVKPLKVDLEVGGEARAHPYFWAGVVTQFHPDALQSALRDLKVNPLPVQEDAPEADVAPPTEVKAPAFEEPSTKKEKDDKAKEEPSAPETAPTQDPDQAPKRKVEEQTEALKEPSFD